MKWKKILTVEASVANIIDLANKVYNVQKILNMGLDKRHIMMWIDLAMQGTCGKNPYIVGDYKFAYEMVDNNIIHVTFFRKMETNNTKPYVASYVAYMTTEEMSNLSFDSSIKDKKTAACCIKKWLNEHLVFPKGTQLNDNALERLFNNKEVWLDEGSYLIMDPMTDSVHYYIRKYKVECTNSFK